MESITGGNTPKYQELMEQLRLQIVSGEIAPGQKLPSEIRFPHSIKSAVRRCARHWRFCRMKDIFTQSTGAVHSAQNDAARTSVQEYCCCNNLSVRLYFPRVIQGIDDVLTGAGYSIVLKNTKNSRIREAECLQEILSKDIDGVIIEPSKSQIFCRHMNLYEQLENRIFHTCLSRDVSHR